LPEVKTSFEKAHFLSRISTLAFVIPAFKSTSSSTKLPNDLGFILAGLNGNN
jgi:hypothetical protein